MQSPLVKCGLATGTRTEQPKLIKNMELILKTILLFIIAIVIGYYPRAKIIKEMIPCNWLVAYYWAITFREWE